MYIINNLNGDVLVHTGSFVLHLLDHLVLIKEIMMNESQRKLEKEVFFFSCMYESRNTILKVFRKNIMLPAPY